MKVRTRKGTVKVEHEGITVEVEQVIDSDVRAARERHTTVDGDKEVPDIEAIGGDLFVQRVKSWAGDLTDEDNNALACNEDNKRLVWTYDNKFATAVMKKANDALESKKDLDTKN